MPGIFAPVQESTGCARLDIRTLCSRKATALSEAFLELEPDAELVGIFEQKLLESMSRKNVIERGRSGVIPVAPAQITRGRYGADKLHHLKAVGSGELWSFLEADQKQKALAAYLDEKYKQRIPGPIPLPSGFIVRSDHFRACQRWLLSQRLGVDHEIAKAATSDAEASSLRDVIFQRLAGWFLAQRYGPDRVVPLSDSLGIPKNLSLLQTASLAADATGNLIITFANSDYASVVDNWLIGLDKLGGLPVMLCALDAELAVRFRREGVPVAHVPYGGSLNDLWAIRAKVIYDLVSAGFNVIHSDADAVWLRDPLPMLDKLEADIISSQGTIFPPSCHDVWGYVLCYGFIQFRASEPSLDVLRELNAQAEETEQFDDQLSLNERLLVLNPRWSVDAPYELTFRNKSFVCSPSPIAGDATMDSGATLRIVILPHAQVQRLPNDIENAAEAYVRHPFSEKSADGIEAALREQSCWFIESSG